MAWRFTVELWERLPEGEPLRIPDWTFRILARTPERALKAAQTRAARIARDIGTHVVDPEWVDWNVIDEVTSEWWLPNGKGGLRCADA